MQPTFCTMRHWKKSKIYADLAHFYSTIHHWAMAQEYATKAREAWLRIKWESKI